MPLEDFLKLAPVRVCFMWGNFFEEVTVISVVGFWALLFVILIFSLSPCGEV